MADRFEQQERYGADLACVSKARVSQAKGAYQPKEVPTKLGAQPHSRVKELPAQPVGEHQQDNMFEQPQNMLQEEVVNVSPFIPQQQQLRHQQHNIARNPVTPKQTVVGTVFHCSLLQKPLVVSVVGSSSSILVSSFFLKWCQKHWGWAC